MINEAEDFIFILADMPHQPVNLSAAEPVQAPVSWNNPIEHEGVVPYDPAQEA